MAERKMSAKGFLNKVLKYKSAEGFLKQYREYLLTGELYSITTPIVDRLDNGDLLPTPAMAELTNVVFAHIQAIETQKALDSIANKESEGGSTAGASKPVQAIIFDSNGNETDRKGCDKGQEGMRWVDRRLFEASPGSYGEVVHTSVMIKGEPMKETISREDSFARILGNRSPGPVLKRRPTSVSRLGGQMKVSQSRAHFSHG
jgi:hypothetical protein